MSEKICISIESECPQCETKISYCISDPDEPARMCPFCGATLDRPDPEGVRRLLAQRRIKAERKAYMQGKYGHLRPEDMTDELRAQKEADERRFQDALDEVTATRFGTVADVRRRLAAKQAQKK